MRCPLCGANTRVDNTISTRGRAIRSRTCESPICGQSLQTAEIPIGPKEAIDAVKEMDLMVLASGSATEQPDSGKIEPEDPNA